MRNKINIFVFVMAVVSMVSAVQAVPVLAKDNGNSQNAKPSQNNTRGLGNFFKNFSSLIQSGFHPGLGPLSQNTNSNGSHENDSDYHTSSSTSPMHPNNKGDDDKNGNNGKKNRFDRPCIFIAPTSTTSQAWMNVYKHGYAGLPLCQQADPVLYNQLLQCVANYVPPPPPVNQPPVISSVGQVVTSPTAATISWQTNESADSAVYYSTSTPVMNSPNLNTIHLAPLVISHQVFLTGLVPNTLYYYLVTSTDSGNLSATSSTSSFVTPSVPIPPPVISSIASSSITSNSATISWTTDTLSTSNVFYATSTPVLSSPYLGTSTSLTLTTSHLVNLSGLSASSTYYFLVSSTDAQNMTSTSSESNFTTQ